MYLLDTPIHTRFVAVEVAVYIYIYFTKRILHNDIKSTKYLYHGAWADQRLPTVLQIFCYPVNNTVM